MFALSTFFRLSFTLFALLVVGLASGQVSTAASQSAEAAQQAPSSATSERIEFDDFVDSLVQQERRLTEFVQSFKPIIETYIQEEGHQYRFQRGDILNGDDYFLGRLDLTRDSPSIVPLADEENWYQGAEKYYVQDPLPFSQAAFAQALFPDFGHFDRQNYSFEFVRWEVLGDVRCAAIDVSPRGNSKNRGFVGRIWAEDRNYSIVRFKGTFTSKGLAKRAFHFDSWRLNAHGNWWMPAYVYTEEWRTQDLPSHKLWFRAQTRVWGYDRRNTSDHPQNAKETDGPEELAKSSPREKEDRMVDRSQVIGLMAPDGQVNQVLETVVNNLLITNNLDIDGIRCRVLLTTPLESFVMGRTIVLSRGLLDVLPDEATLAAVLAHELAHVVLGHAVRSAYPATFGFLFPDSPIFEELDFHFDRTQEKEANKKARELFLKSPYKDRSENIGFFLQALDDNSARFPMLLHGRFSNDFQSSHLMGMQAATNPFKHAKKDRRDQISALPIGSRIVVDPWSDRIEMLKIRPVPLASPAEKIPFEVTPFLPHLKRVDAPMVPQSIHSRPAPSG